MYKYIFMYYKTGENWKHTDFYSQGITATVTLAVSLSRLRAIYISLLVHNHFLLSLSPLSILSLLLFFLPNPMISLSGC